MNDVRAQYEVATVAMAQRQQRVQGQQSVKLIEGAAAAQQLTSPAPPPPQPVSVTPREGSSIEVIA